MTMDTMIEPRLVAAVESLHWLPSPARHEVLAAVRAAIGPAMAAYRLHPSAFYDTATARQLVQDPAMAVLARHSPEVHALLSIVLAQAREIERLHPTRRRPNLAINEDLP